jgi:hypothetical protein
MDPDLKRRAIALEWWAATVFIAGSLIYGIGLALAHVCT